MDIIKNGSITGANPAATQRLLFPLEKQQSVRKINVAVNQILPQDNDQLGGDDAMDLSADINFE